MRRTEHGTAGDEKSRPQDSKAECLAGIAETQARVAKLPVLDDRSAEEIIGYDKFGLPS